MSDADNAPWVQLTLEAVRHTPEQLEDALLAAGAVAVTLQDAGDQPILEPAPDQTPLWSHTRVTGLFDAQTDVAVVKQALCHTLSEAVLPECRLESLEERDWVRAWLDDFHAMRFGRRLWVCPKNQPPPHPEAVNLFLDPGLAFGTGTHPTTALCLNWLDGQNLDGQSLLDYGCGSGILAIAAARLGATSVWAVDIDPQALLATIDNAAANGVGERIHSGHPADLPTQTFDVVVANILAGTLIGLADALIEQLRPGGRLALAGILADQESLVKAAFADRCHFGPSQQREGWVLLQAERR